MCLMTPIPGERSHPLLRNGLCHGCYFISLDAYVSKYGTSGFETCLNLPTLCDSYIAQEWTSRNQIQQGLATCKRLKVRPENPLVIIPPIWIVADSMTPHNHPITNYNHQATELFNNSIHLPTTAIRLVSGVCLPFCLGILGRSLDGPISSDLHILSSQLPCFQCPGSNCSGHNLKALVVFAISH